MQTLLTFLCLSSVAWASLILPAVALPPPDDIPEEVLRAQIILEGRSPITGAPLTAAERAALEATLTANANSTVELPPEVQNVFFLLAIRKGLRLFIPFIP